MINTFSRILSLILAVSFNLQYFCKFLSYDRLISCSRKFCFSFCLRFTFLLGNTYLDEKMQAIIFTLLILVDTCYSRIPEWIGMLELTCGRLDGSWITGTERKHFHIFFSFLCFHYYRDGGNFSDN